jgi:hypothetical protein
MGPSISRDPSASELITPSSVASGEPRRAQRQMFDVIAPDELVPKPHEVVDRTPLIGPPAMRAWVGWFATAERTGRG